MTAPAHGSPHAVLDDACRRTEQILDDLLDRADPVLAHVSEITAEDRDAIRTEIAALRSARALADARAKQAEADRPDVGGTTLDLSLEEARYLRALLAFVAQSEEQWCEGVEIAPGGVDPRALRKRINQGISKTTHDRCGLERAEEFRALRGADAVCDSEDTDEAAS